MPNQREYLLYPGRVKVRRCWLARALRRATEGLLIPPGPLATSASAFLSLTTQLTAPALGCSGTATGGGAPSHPAW